MEEKQYDVAAVKRRLNRYREKERDIDTQIERLGRLETRLTGIRSPVISDMPKSHGAVDDRLVNLIAEKDELESKIRGDIKAQTEAWHEIEDILDTLTKSDEKAVIRVRYHDRESWSAVSKILFGKRRDFSEKADSYLRRVHKLHGSALVNLAKAVEAQSHTSKHHIFIAEMDGRKRPSFLQK